MRTKRKEIVFIDFLFVFSMCWTRDMASSLELKRLITLRERENKMLREDLLETKNWIDMKMNQQIMLHDQMVINHRQMLDKCKVYKEDLELANLENDRFKCIAQSLANKVEELTGNKIEKRSDHGYNDEYSDVKVSEIGFNSAVLVAD